MGSSYVTLWAKFWIKRIQLAHDKGPLEVIFGGPHISLPSISHVVPGDRIYPIFVDRGAIFVIACLNVTEIIEAEHYVYERLGVERREGIGLRRLASAQLGLGHRLPRTCADLAAVGTGSELVWDRSLNPRELESLRLGPKPGKEMPLKNIADGLLKRDNSLRSHVRRVSEETRGLLERVVG